MRKAAGVVLTLVVLIVAGMSVPAHAAPPASYAPWTEDQVTYKPDGNGPCRSFNDARLRREEASREALSQPDPVAFYRAAAEKRSGDLKAMPLACRIMFSRQVVTLLTALNRSDRQVYLTANGREILIHAGIDCCGDPSTDPSLAQEAINARDSYGGPSWGVVAQHMDLLASAYTVVGAALAIGGIYASNSTDGPRVK